MCRRLTPRAVHVLDALMDDADGRLRLAAAMAILDRAHGKPVQAITSPDEATSLTFLHLVAMRAFSDELHAGRTIDAAVADDTNTVSRETNGTKPPRNLMEPATE